MTVIMKQCREASTGIEFSYFVAISKEQLIKMVEAKLLKITLDGIAKSIIQLNSLRELK